MVIMKGNLMNQGEHRNIIMIYNMMRESVYNLMRNKKKQKINYKQQQKSFEYLI